MPGTHGKIRVEVHVTRRCGYCRAAKALLDREGIRYEEIDVSDAAGRDALRQRSGWSSVPVIYIDGELLGGYVELNGLKRRGGLQTLKA